MIELYLPDLPPVVGGNVIVPSEVWDKLMQYLNAMRERINTQADTITNLTKDLNTAKLNITTIAKGLEDLLYENP